MDPGDAKEKFLAASKLLSVETTTVEKFEEVRKLIKGTHPRIDRLLESCSETISKIEKLQKGAVIELAAESLPEKTEEEKRRKKILLLFIKNWKELQEEIERVKKELDGNQTKNTQERVKSFGKIAAFAKGPFGIITILAILVVSVLIFSEDKTSSTTTSIANSASPSLSQSPSSTSNKAKIKVITYNNKRLALSQLTTAVGAECLNNDREQASHYHAKNHTAALAIDGTMVADPGGCGFGKVSETMIEEVY